jgi:hypothetical protein
MSSIDYLGSVKCDREAAGLIKILIANDCDAVVEEEKEIFVGMTECSRDLSVDWILYPQMTANICVKQALVDEAAFIIAQKFTEIGYSYRSHERLNLATFRCDALMMLKLLLSNEPERLGGRRRPILRNIIREAA